MKSIHKILVLYRITTSPPHKPITLLLQCPISEKYFNYFLNGTNHCGTEIMKKPGRYIQQHYNCLAIIKKTTTKRKIRVLCDILNEPLDEPMFHSELTSIPSTISEINFWYIRYTYF